MDALVEKLSAYEVLNNIVPGALFSFLCDTFLETSLIGEDSLANFCVFFIVGLFCSRIGSLVVEPFYKNTKIVNYAPYPHYLDAKDKDVEIKDLLSVNNLYRTMVGGCFGILLLKAYFCLEENCPCLAENRFFVVVSVVVIMFSFAYRKQTDYIRKRVERIVEKKHQVNSDDDTSQSKM